MVGFPRHLFKSFSGNIRRGLCSTEEMWRMTEQLPAEGSIISQISLFAFAKFRCHSGLSAKPQPTISQLVTHGTAMASGLPLPAKQARRETCQV